MALFLYLKQLFGCLDIPELSDISIVLTEMTVAVTQKLALLRITSELRWSTSRLLGNKEEQLLVVLLTV